MAVDEERGISGAPFRVEFLFVYSKRSPAPGVAGAEYSAKEHRALNAGKLIAVANEFDCRLVRVLSVEQPAIVGSRFDYRRAGSATAVPPHYGNNRNAVSVPESSRFTFGLSAGVKRRRVGQGA